MLSWSRSHKRGLREEASSTTEANAGAEGGICKDCKEGQGVPSCSFPLIPNLMASQIKFNFSTRDHGYDLVTSPGTRMA